jgi:pimeloyl-ACP methyl ester carboxylesterase
VTATTRTVEVRSGHLGTFAIPLTEQGAGRPTVYLHGELLPPDPPAWLATLAETRRVLAPQHPGFGRATGLEHLDDVHDLVGFYRDLLGALDLGTVDLIGESFGGMLAAELAAAVGPQVRRLVLVAPFGFWRDDQLPLDIFGVPAAELHHQAWAAPDSETTQAYWPPVGDDDAQYRAMVERMRSLAAAGKFMFPIPDKGLRKRIHRVTAPTLLLWGAEDRVVPPSYAAIFRDGLPQASIALISAAGHFPLLEQPDAALAELRSFLDSA